MLKHFAVLTTKLITVIAELATPLARTQNLAYRGSALPIVQDPRRICATGTGEKNWSKLSAISSSFCSVDFQSDNDNCGACNTTCADAQSCVKGVCTCPSSTPDPCSGGW